MGAAESVSEVDAYTGAIGGMLRGRVVGCVGGSSKMGSGVVGGGMSGVGRGGSAGGTRLGGMWRDEMRSTGSGEGSLSVTVAMASIDGVFGSWTTVLTG